MATPIVFSEPFAAEAEVPKRCGSSHALLTFLKICALNFRLGELNRFAPVNRFKNRSVAAATVLGPKERLIKISTTIYTDIGGNRLNLSIGGVKAYNLDNLYSRSGSVQHFKIFIGFKNTVCTNLCVSTDGYMADLKVKTPEMLRTAVRMLLQDFNSVELSEQLQDLNRYELTEQQFAQLIGRCRMYKYLPENFQASIPELMFGESQLNTICGDYYRDKSFCRSEVGSINLWNLYNLFTGANKSSYIDSFLDRSVNALQLVGILKTAIQNKGTCWYLG